MNHKRRRTRSRRAGCNLCKPWKKNGCSSKWMSRREKRAQANEKDQRDEQTSKFVRDTSDGERS